MKAVIFDLDGTLVDSAADLQAAANRLMRQNFLPELDRATVTCFIGNGIVRLVERCFAHHGVTLPEAPDGLSAQVARFIQYYAEEEHRRTRFMPGAEAALRQLKARGYRLGLCTNKDSGPTLAILRRLRAEGLFQVVVGGDSGLAKKPDPAPLLAAISACAATPAQALYVGDSETDAQTAGFAKVPFLLFTEGYRSTPCAALRHDGSFGHFALLPQVVEAMAARHGGDGVGDGVGDGRATATVLPFPKAAKKAV